MAMTLITTNSHSGDSDATSSFTSSIDSTYKLYIFKFINIHPQTDETELTFQVNASDATGYNETMTTTCFRAHHSEDDSTTALSYDDSRDQAQGTSFQKLSAQTGNGADENLSGTLWLFNPSNTTYVKHFYARTNNYYSENHSYDSFISGYINETTGIDDVQFKMSSGNINGVIKMYGVG